MEQTGRRLTNKSTRQALGITTILEAGQGQGMISALTDKTDWGVVESWMKPTMMLMMMVVDGWGRGGACEELRERKSKNKINKIRQINLKIIIPK